MSGQSFVDKTIFFNKENLTAIKRQSRHWTKLWYIGSCQIQYHYNVWKILIRYCFEDIITKVTFSYFSINKLWTEFFQNFFILLQYICGNDFSPIRIIFKLTFLFQLFSKFRENVIWPMKAKFTIYAKTLFRETLKAFA